MLRIRQDEVLYYSLICQPEFNPLVVVFLAKKRERGGEREGGERERGGWGGGGGGRRQTDIQKQIQRQTDKTERLTD